MARAAAAQDVAATRQAGNKTISAGVTAGSLSEKLRGSHQGISIPRILTLSLAPPLDPQDRTSRTHLGMSSQRLSLHAAPKGEMNASARTFGLFADRPSAAAALSARHPLGGMAAAGARRMGLVASHGADGDLADARAAENDRIGLVEHV